MAHSGKTMTFATDLVPQENNIYSLGKENLKWIIRGSLPLSDITGADDLKAIEALTGTSGLLKKTAANTWALDTTSYLPLSGGTITGTTASTSTSTGALIVSGGVGVDGRVTAEEFNATRTMVVSAGKVYSNISGSNVLQVAKTTSLYANGLAIAHPGLNPANDVGWLRVTGTSESDMAFEIATGDDGGTSTGERIVVRQYNTSNAIAKEAVLLEKQTGATTFPVSVTAPALYKGTSVVPDTGNTTGNVGNTTTSVYVEAGIIKSGSTYAGGTAITLNGDSKSASTASFYAPATAGTSGYVLKSQGTGAPEWEQEYSVEIVHMT